MALSRCEELGQVGDQQMINLPDFPFQEQTLNGAPSTPFHHEIIADPAQLAKEIAFSRSR